MIIAASLIMIHQAVTGRIQIQIAGTLSNRPSGCWKAMQITVNNARLKRGMTCALVNHSPYVSLGLLKYSTEEGYRIPALIKGIRKIRNELYRLMIP